MNTHYHLGTLNQNGGEHCQAMATILTIRAVPTHKKKVVQSVAMISAQLTTLCIRARCSQTEHLSNDSIIYLKTDGVMDAFPSDTFHIQIGVPIHSKDVKNVP